MPKLEKWSVIDIRGPYDPPELGHSALRGIVSGHHRKKDGTIVHTSDIIGVSTDKVLTCSGTAYELGEVDPEYAALYPDARQRLFATWPKVAEA